MSEQSNEKWKQGQPVIDRSEIIIVLGFLEPKESVDHHANMAAKVADRAILNAMRT